MDPDPAFPAPADRTAAERNRILHRRAAALARRHERPEEAEILIDIVEFALAQEFYAVESAFVREVQPLRGLTPVPCTPPFILGIVNIRGQILPVLDLKKFFELPERGISDLDKLLILSSGAMEIGVLADAILGVSSIPMSGLQSTLPTLSGIRADYLLGVTADRIAVLHTEKLLADQRIIVNEEVPD